MDNTTTARGLFFFSFYLPSVPSSYSPFTTIIHPILHSSRSPLWYNRTMDEKESRISKENRIIRKANCELDRENKELKARVEELEEENKRLDESVRALKDELFRVMVENEDLKRRN